MSEPAPSAAALITFERFGSIVSAINRTEFEFREELAASGVDSDGIAVSGLILREMLLEAVTMIAANLGRKFPAEMRAEIRTNAQAHARRLLEVFDLYE